MNTATRTTMSREYSRKNFFTNRYDHYIYIKIQNYIQDDFMWTIMCMYDVFHFIDYCQLQRKQSEVNSPSFLASNKAKY